MPSGGVLINPPANALGGCNAIMAWRGEKCVDAIVGCLSVKWMPVGTSVWRTSSQTFRVAGDRYLVLNHGREYSLRRDGREPQASFCPLFAPGFVEEAHRALVARPEALLEAGPHAPPAPIEFCEQLYDADEWVSPQLRRMYEGLRRGNPTQTWLEEEFHRLADRLVLAQREMRRQIDRLPAQRPSTREELHRRVQRGREYLHAHFDQPLRLDDMARAACLSTHHFRRLFAAAFGRTPHRYLTELRLERARALLTRTEQAVTDVCHEVGFESLGSFSSLFRRWSGQSPEQMRRAAARN